MAGGAQGVKESFAAFRQVFRNPNLRRIELAWASSVVANWAYGVALAVFAYNVGGAAAVGVVGLVRFLPPAVTAPFIAMLADRYPRQRVMYVTDTARSALLFVAAGAFAIDAPAWTIYALAGLVAVLASTIRPAQAALLPSLAQSPQELTAANVTSSTIESVGIFAGPALGGLLLAVSSPGVVFGAAAGALLISAILEARVRVPERAEVAVTPSTRRGRAAFAGFQTIAADRDLRVLVALFGAQTLVAGAMNVLIVVTALELLDIGESGVGALNSAIGVGGFLGAVAAFGLVGRGRLAADFSIGILLWGLPIALIGIYPNPITALLLLAVVGVGNTLVDVSALTLLQRSAPDEVLARVFGAIQSLAIGTIGLGSILAPLLIAGIGVRGALIVTGAALPLVAALLWRRLSVIDERTKGQDAELVLLRENPIFAPLPPAVLDSLAGNLVRLERPAGEVVFRQGDSGDRYYVVGEGEVEVAVNGQPARTLGRGEGFGEIALLHDVPRTATVTTRTDVTLYALDRDDFISAVTGYPASADAADAVVASRMGSLRPELGSV